jgi:hypothetical protein
MRNVCVSVQFDWGSGRLPWAAHEDSIPAHAYIQTYIHSNIHTCIFSKTEQMQLLGKLSDLMHEGKCHELCEARDLKHIPNHQASIHACIYTYIYMYVSIYLCVKYSHLYVYIYVNVWACWTAFQYAERGTVRTYRFSRSSIAYAYVSIHVCVCVNIHLHHPNMCICLYQFTQSHYYS